MPKFNWKGYFPYPEVRPGQEKAINEIIDSFESGKRYFILEAGTGVGKSAIASTVATYVEKHILPGESTSVGSNILTTQKLLQEQYKRDFPAINSLKSSSNYTCTFHKKQNCNESRKMLQTTDRSSPFIKR